MWEVRVIHLLAYAEIKFRARQLSEEVLRQKVGMLMEGEGGREDEEEGGSAGRLTEEEWKKVREVNKILKGGGREGGRGDKNEAIHRVMWEGEDEEEDGGEGMEKEDEDEEEEEEEEEKYDDEEEEDDEGRGGGGRGGRRGGRSPFAGVVAVAEDIARQLADDCRAVAGGGVKGRKIKIEGQRGGGGGGGGGGAGGRKRELIPVLNEEGKKRRKPLAWTDMELTRLLKGLSLFGHHRSLVWVKIKGFDARASRPVLGNRSPLDVKDKARNIEKSVRREMEMRGVRWSEEWWNERGWAKLALSDHALFLSLQGGGR